MKIDFQNCREEELWKYIALHLNAHGIDNVLVGGAVVSIYTNGLYESGDLDFIVSSIFKERLPGAMRSIGFEKQGRHYAHPECKHLFVEFPPGPLAIGDDTRLLPQQGRVNGKVIQILSPTDCIKDRLSSYIHYKSRETLDQAVLVAKNQPFKASEVKRWCLAENAAAAFDEFQRLFKA